jgi:hypothetical protein
MGDGVRRRLEDWEDWEDWEDFKRWLLFIFLYSNKMKENLTNDFIT